MTRKRFEKMLLPNDYLPDYGLNEIGSFDNMRLPHYYRPNYELGAFGIDRGFQSMNITGYTENQLAAIAFLKSIHREVVVNDMSFLGGVEGRHRSAKSTTTTFMGYLLDPTFWKFYDERLVIEPKEIMEAIENILKYEIHGGVIQVEEAGIGLASADRYEAQAKILEKVVQGIGWLNPIIMFISLDRKAVNPRIRGLLQMVFSFSKASKLSTTMFPRELYYIKSKSGGAWGTRCPTVEFMGEIRSLTEIEWMRPPQFIIDRYEEYAGKQKPDTFNKLNKEIQISERMKMKEERDIKKVVLDVVSNYLSYLTEDSKPEYPTLDKVAIRYGMGIASEEAIWVKREAEKVLRAGAKEAKKMKFTKTTSIRESWTLEAFGAEIPLEAIFAMLRGVGIAVLLFIMILVGQLVQSENMKWLAKMRGIQDERTGLYLTCDPILNESAVLGYQWKCQNETTPRG